MLIRIVTYLKRFPRIVYFRKVLVGSLSKEYVQLTIADNRHFLQKLGSAEPHNIYYIIHIDDPSGFFGTLFVVLRYMLIAKQNGYKPAISYSDRCLNYDNEFSRNSSQYNTFNYYFQIKNGIARSEKWLNASSYSFAHAVVARFAHLVQLDSTYVRNKQSVYQLFLDETFMKDVAEVYAEKLSIRPELKSQIEKEAGDLSGGSEYLAVHFRGTDMRHASANHPVSLTEEDYFIQIDKILSGNENLKVFLATDDNAALRAFQERYGNKLIFFSDAKRSSTDAGIHYITAGAGSGGFRQGYETLRDAIVLSEGRTLVCGLSSVAAFAAMLRIVNEKNTEADIIISKGISTSRTELKQLDGTYRAFLSKYKR